MIPTWCPDNLTTHQIKRNSDIANNHCNLMSWISAHQISYPLTNEKLRYISEKVHRDHVVSFLAAIDKDGSDQTYEYRETRIFKFDLYGYMIITNKMDTKFISCYHIHYAKPKEHKPRYSTTGPCLNTLNESNLILRAKNFLLHKSEQRHLQYFKNIKNMQRFNFNRVIEKGWCR